MVKPKKPTTLHSHRIAILRDIVAHVRQSDRSLTLESINVKLRMEMYRYCLKHAYHALSKMEADDRKHKRPLRLVVRILVNVIHDRLLEQNVSLRKKVGG